MTAQDRKDIEAALRTPGHRGMEDTRVTVIESLIEQARDEGRRQAQGAFMGYMGQRRRLIAALLRSRRIDRAALAAVKDIAVPKRGEEGFGYMRDEHQIGVNDAYDLICVVMAEAECTAREENR